MLNTFKDKALNKLPEIHALWIGGKLNKIAICCLRSFALKGHKVNLHIYREIENVPVEINCVDANLILPESKIFKHTKTGSYALFSDLFRFELLTKVDGIYVDCDVYCLNPLVIPDSGYALGFEDDNHINGAVLALPKNSDLLATFVNISKDPYFIPEWYSRSKKRKLNLLKKIGFGKHIKDLEWGILGPHAITYFIEKMGLWSLIQPMDIYYPIHYTCIKLLLDEKLNIDDLITYRTQCIHLYNEMFRQLDLNEIPENCVLSRMFRNEI